MNQNVGPEYIRGWNDAVSEMLGSLAGKIKNPEQAVSPAPGFDFTVLPMQPKILDHGMAAVFMVQSGGKYCSFQCPVCASEAYFKMTSNSGACDACKTTFQNLETLHKMAVRDGVRYPDEIGICEYYTA